MPNSKKKIQNPLALKVNWALFCKNASIDQASNNISLFNVIDEVTLSKNPEIEVAMRDKKTIEIKLESALVVQFERKEPADMPGYSVFVQLRTIDPDGKELGKFDLSLEMQKSKRRARVLINFTNLLITKAGDYAFVISLRYPQETAFSEAVSVPLEIRIA